MIARAVSLWHRWGPKVGFSIADQGIVSGANFVLNILLARWFTPAEYGAFAIAFSVFLFLSGFHNALILEPMSVIGPSRYKGQLAKYLEVTIWIHGGLTLGLAGILAIAAAIMAVIESSLLSSFLGLAIAVLFILLFWFLRRACYLDTRPDLALKGSFSYALFLLLGLFIMQRQSWLSPFNAFLLMAQASLVASLVFWRSLGMRVSKVSWAGGTPGTGVVLAEHWRYGRWVVGSAFVNWLSSAAYLPLVGALAGLAEAGVFRAMQNVVLPLQQTLTAMGLLFLPWVAGRQVVQDESYLKKALSKISVVNMSLASVYVLFLILFGQWIVEFLYDQSYYGRFLWMLPYLGAVAVVQAAAQGLGIGLKALERPDAVFWSQTAGVLLTLTVGLYLVWTLRLYGAAVGSFLSALLMTMVLACFLWRYLRLRR